MGTAALGRAWRQTTARSLRPCAGCPDVVWPSSSSMAVRTMRVRMAASEAPMAMAGRTRLTPIDGRAAAGVGAETGSHPNRMEKARISTGQRQPRDREAKQTHYGKCLIQNAPPAHGGQDAGRQGKQKPKSQRGQRQAMV